MIKDKDYNLLEEITSLKNELKFNEDNPIKTRREILDIFCQLGIYKKPPLDLHDIPIGDDRRRNLVNDEIKEFFYSFHSSIVDEHKRVGVEDSFYSQWTNNDYYEKCFQRFLDNIPSFIREVLTKTTGIEENIKLCFILVLNKLICTYILNSSKVLKDREVELVYNALQVLNNKIKNKLETSSNLLWNIGVEGFNDAFQEENRYYDSEDLDDYNGRVERSHEQEYSRLAYSMYETLRATTDDIAEYRDVYDNED